MRLSRNFAGTAARITAVALLGGASACGAIGSGGNPNATAGVGPALLRFVQGSGVRTDNVFDQNGVRCTSGFGLALDGQLVSQPLFYGQITSYLAVSAKTHRVDVYCGSAKTSEVLGPFVTPALAPGSTVSLVTAGRFDRGTLQVMVFVEPPTSSAGTIVFHHAAPEFPTTYDFGALDVMGGTYARLGAIGYSPVDNIPQPSAPSAIVPTPAPLPTNPALASAAAPAFGANGLAVYVGSGTTPLVTPPPTPAPAATVSPTPHPSPVPGAPIYASSIDRNDLANALPFGAEATFSVFVVDPDSGNIPQLIGALE